MCIVNLSQLWIKNLVEKSIKLFRLELVRSSRIGLGWQNSFVLRFNLYQYFRFVVFKKLKKKRNFWIEPISPLFISSLETTTPGRETMNYIMNYSLSFFVCFVIAWFSSKMAGFLERWSSELISWVSFLLPFKFQHRPLCFSLLFCIEFPISVFRKLLSICKCWLS